MTHKSYLGDGVYADIENGMVKLTVENGIEATDTIFLEDENFEALVAYVERKPKFFADARAAKGES
jgi:hypothetical protein